MQSIEIEKGRRDMAGGLRAKRGLLGDAQLQIDANRDIAAR